MAEWKEDLVEQLDKETHELATVDMNDDLFAAKVKRIRQVQVLLEEGKKVEETGFSLPKWFERHSDALISAGATLVGVIVIVGGEQLGPMLLNTKAWPFIPKPRI